MWKLLIHSDLRNWPKHLFLFCLLVFPAIAYAVTRPAIGITPYMALGIICVTFLIYRLIEIYRKGENLIVPTYIVLFGLFIGYTLYCHMFVSDYFEERGIKLFFSDTVWLSFLAMIVVENIKFSDTIIKYSKIFLFLMIIVAAIVSIIQISNPLFFLNDQFLVQGISYDRMTIFYNESPEGLSKAQAAFSQRFLEGYKLSIFSYINGTSVGMDTIAIFSILLSWQPMENTRRGVITIAAGIISFLSSSRWIILGFFIVASQYFFIGKNKLRNFIYFLIFGLLLILLFAIIATLIGFDIEQYVTQRLMSDSALTRLLAFEVFGKVFPDNPILGTGGVDTTEMVRLLGGQSSQIHVGFLKLFYYYGLLGGTLYIAFMFSFMIRLWKRAKSSGYWGGFFAILSFFVANLTLFELSIFYFGPLLALIFANHFYANKKKEGDAIKQKENEIYSSLKIKFNG